MVMGSSGKKRTTMAKLNRESRLRDKRADKDARKAARKLAGPSDNSELGYGFDPFEDSAVDTELALLDPEDQPAEVAEDLDAA
jgi:hypothetical protein